VVTLQKGNVEAIVKVRKTATATKLVISFKNIFTDRLIHLGLPTLKYRTNRRLRGNTMEVLKININMIIK